MQLVDNFVGVGREAARVASQGTFDDELQVAVHEILHNIVMTADGAPLDALIKRRPLPYRDEWIAAHWSA